MKEVEAEKFASNGEETLYRVRQGDHRGIYKLIDGKLCDFENKSVKFKYVLKDK